jgi:NAD(P)-dependent dehydrogenase (short-subunit alcohol dehydrogenase family)
LPKNNNPKKEQSMGRVEGKIAIVTGGASGIGQAAAEALAREGASVVVTDIQKPEGEAAVAKIVNAGGKAVFKVQDVVDEDVWEDVVSSTVKEFGGLDILVNNAGIALPGMVVEMTLERWQRQRAVNLDSIFLGTKYAIPAMAASGGGSIVNISSVAGLRGSAGLTGYNATKGGVRLFTKGVAMECAAGGLNIRVNSVHPGNIDTPIWTKLDLGMGDVSDSHLPIKEGANAVDVHALAEANVPLGVAGTSAEIAAGIIFLASDEASHMTGSELVIDGGITA